MTYRELKAHCKAHQYCADCEYAECRACRDLEDSPCYIPDGDQLLDVVIPESMLKPSAAKRRMRLQRIKSYSWLILVSVLIILLVLMSFFFEVIWPADIQHHEQPPTSMFVEVESTNKWYVVYHRETHVMYAVSRGEYDFTLLVNPDGTPMVYNE